MTKVYNQYYKKFSNQMAVKIGEATRTLQAEKRGNFLHLAIGSAKF